MINPEDAAEWLEIMAFVTIILVGWRIILFGFC